MQYMAAAIGKSSALYLGWCRRGIFLSYEADGKLVKKVWLKPNLVAAASKHVAEWARRHNATYNHG